MSDYEENVLSENIEQAIAAQAESANIGSDDVEGVEILHECTNDMRVKCATQHGPRAVENKILVSISENINTMATAIKNSEAQKHSERSKCIRCFFGVMVFLVLLAAGLIIADTFFGYSVKIEFLVSVILAILADVFAIVHTLVKYMTNTENYEAYGKLIDSLLKHINNKDTE